MTRGNLPPQAYTRDQVTASYQWLQTQPENIRRQATNADAMVALYLRAKRTGELNFTEAPVSERTFRENLKTIANELQNFEPRPGQQTTLPFLEAPAPNQILESNSVTRPIGTLSVTQSQQTQQTQTQTQQLPTVASHTHNQSKVQNVEIKEVVQSIKTTTATSSTSDTNMDIDLDAESWSRLSEIKQRLNLSHEREALRMILVLGYERLQKMLS